MNIVGFRLLLGFLKVFAVFAITFMKRLTMIGTTFRLAYAWLVRNAPTSAIADIMLFTLS